MVVPALQQQQQQLQLMHTNLKQHHCSTLPYAATAECLMSGVAATAMLSGASSSSSNIFTPSSITALHFLPRQFKHDAH
jgi:hypothetical protein